MSAEMEEKKIQAEEAVKAPEKDPDHWREPAAEPYCKLDCANCPHPCHFCLGRAAGFLQTDACHPLVGARFCA